MTGTLLGVLGVLGVSGLLVTVRLVRGPSAMDRLVALDTLIAVIVCVLAVGAVLTLDSAPVPVVVATSLVGFLGSTTVARYLGRPEDRAGRPAPPATSPEARRTPDAPAAPDAPGTPDEGDGR